MTKTTKKGVDIMDRIFFNKYKPLTRLGEGSFGKVFSALNMETNEKFALKMEPREKGQSPLEAEAYILSYLKSRKHSINNFSWNSRSQILRL